MELWLGPDLNADLLELTAHPDHWPVARTRCAMLQMFEQQIGSDAENANDVGLNYYPRLRDEGFFSALTLPLAAEIPGLKRWDTENGVPTGKQAAYALTRAINRILAAGGRLLASYSMDDPFAESLTGFSSPVPIETVTAVLCRVAKAGSDLGVFGGITEAYPTCSVAQIIDLFGHVQQAGWSPRHLHMDVDEQHAKQVHSDAKISADLKELQAACRSWGIPFGVILNGQRGDTPPAYRTGFWEWFDFVRRMLDGDPDRYILESWKKKNLPVNLPESSQFSHTGLLREVAALVPFPVDPPEEHTMPIGVVGITKISGEAHEVVPSGRAGYSLWVRVSDKRVLSLQPSFPQADGSFTEAGKQEYRDPGTDGSFEQCKVGPEESVYDYEWGPTNPDGSPAGPKKRWIHVIANKVTA